MKAEELGGACLLVDKNLVTELAPGVDRALLLAVSPNGVVPDEPVLPLLIAGTGRIAIFRLLRGGREGGEGEGRKRKREGREEMAMHASENKWREDQRRRQELTFMRELAKYLQHQSQNWVS